MDILIDPELSTELVCKRMPFDVDCNSVFVVDMSKLSNPKDIACDDMGVWKWNGSYRRWLSVDEKGVVTVLGKTLAETPSIPYYHIWKRYYENKSSQDLKKMIVTLEGKLQMHDCTCTLDTVDTVLVTQSTVTHTYIYTQYCTAETAVQLGDHTRT